MRNGDRVIIGIGGNIGSGKTTVSMIFENLGARCISADVIGRTVLKDITRDLRERFGEKIMKGKNVNRAKLREIAFSHRENLMYLNRLSHPLLKSKLLQKLDKIESGVVIIDAALLYNWPDILKKIDRAILVTSTRKNKRMRALKQGIESEQFERILSCQKKESEMSKLADYIIKNNGTVQDLEEQCSRIYEEIRDDC